MNRRHFLQTAGAYTLGFAGLYKLLACGDPPVHRTELLADGFGPLIKDPAGVLDLPKGFSYQVFSRSGDAMDDGLFVPALHDGMATFPGPDGRTILIRNHEVNSNASSKKGAFGTDHALFEKIGAERCYDAGTGAGPCLGGTTTLIYNTQTQEVERQFLSLAGTLRNCAGGPTPWNTWITCEETIERAGDFCAKDHGYVFEVPATTEPTLADPIPIKDMGRFNHEAIAVDPASGVVYLTEDQHDGLIYRFVPHTPGRLLDGGRLQALRFLDQASLDTRNWDIQTITQGIRLPVDWIDLEEIEAPLNDLRIRGFDQGAARFARGEGMWYGEGAVYFACTNGGREKAGQIWRYAPSPAEGTEQETNQRGRLELFVEPNDRGLVDNADNLTVSPWGDLIVCEDGGGDQYLVGITPEGTLYKFAHNANGKSEFAGATFSPDGTTLFVNIQKAGFTLAITGPWQT